MGHLAVVAFPEAGDLASVERFRARFDPQASLIAAHVTLVFPFEAPPALPLSEHLASVAAEFAPVRARFEPDARPEGDYLMMTASIGDQNLRSLHARLYSGPLAGFLSTSHVFRPHITLGRVADPDARAAAMDQLRNEVGPVDVVLARLAVFSLELRSVDFTVPLAGDADSRHSRTS